MDSDTSGQKRQAQHPRGPRGQYKLNRHRIEMQRGRWIRDILYEMIACQRMRIPMIAQELSVTQNVAGYWIREFGLQDLYRLVRKLDPVDVSKPLFTDAAQNQIEK